jgi:hypothetical protein
MSNNENTRLFERAVECIGYFEDKLPAVLIQQDLDNDDLESLNYHVNEAERLMTDLEYQPEPITDETMSAWGESLIGEGDVF